MLTIFSFIVTVNSLWMLINLYISNISDNVRSFSEQYNLQFKSSSNEFIAIQSENYGKQITIIIY